MKPEALLVLIVLVSETSKPTGSFPTGLTLGLFLSRSSLLSVIPRPGAGFHLRVLSAVEKDGKTRKKLGGGAAVSLQPLLVLTWPRKG